MIIEITGIPGSGKTYYTQKFRNEIQKKYKNRKVVIVNFKGEVKTIEKILFFINVLDFYLLKLLIKVYFDLKENDSKMTSFKHFILAFYKYYYVFSKNYEIDNIYILDESILHINNYLITLLNGKDFSKYISWLYTKKYFNNFKSSKVIFIDSSVEDAAKNISKRESGWPYIVNGFNSEEKINYLNKFKISVEKNKNFYVENNLKYILITKNNYDNLYNIL